MKAFLIFSIYITCLIAINNSGNTFSEEKIQYCPANNSEAQAVLEKFLTSSSFATARNQTGTNGLSTSQIAVLKDSNSSHLTQCQQLRNVDIFDPEDDTIRATVYYEVGNFYFVSMPIIQEKVNFDGKNLLISGSDFLSILDSNLNIIRTVEL